MTPEAQRIAIAEACGWNPYNTDLWTPPDDGAFASSYQLPDYLNDLNAMHEAEKMLTDGQRIQLVGHLGMITLNSGLYRMEVSASAAQRAEAFLRTLNLWTE